MARNTHVTVGSTTPAVAADWSDSNVPWVYTDTAVFTERWPAETNVVDIQTGGADFYTNLKNTVAAAGARCVVRLGEGVYSLTSFRLIGASGSQTYSFGFWDPNLQGFLGQGADKTFIQMDANSMSAAQISALEVMKSADFAPNLMGILRLDSANESTPILISGVTFRSADQQNLTNKPSPTDWYNAVVPQSAPHQGVVFYSGSAYIIDHCRFQAAGKAMCAAPPFEMANLNTQYSPSGLIYNTEFDGRRSPDLDPARTRQCGVVMLNNDTLSEIVDTWMHHSNVSRYAVNDENRAIQGTYRLTRCKVEQISNTNNEGRSGAPSQASATGWESCNGTIEITDCIISQDNPSTSSAIPHQISLTSVGSRNPQGGRIYVVGGEFPNVFSEVDGFLSIRCITTTYWWIDGFATTMYVRATAGGTRKTAYQVTGAWPPSRASLTALGVTPETHFLVRQ